MYQVVEIFKNLPTVGVIDFLFSTSFLVSSIIVMYRWIKKYFGLYSTIQDLFYSMALLASVFMMLFNIQSIVTCQNTFHISMEFCICHFLVSYFYCRSSTAYSTIRSSKIVEDIVLSLSTLLIIAGVIGMLHFVESPIVHTDIVYQPHNWKDQTKVLVDMSVPDPNSSKLIYSILTYLFVNLILIVVGMFYSKRTRVSKFYVFGGGSLALGEIIMMFNAYYFNIFSKAHEISYAFALTNHFLSKICFGIAVMLIVSGREKQLKMITDDFNTTKTKKMCFNRKK